jgi:hypothetical protein
VRNLLTRLERLEEKAEEVLPKPEVVLICYAPETRRVTEFMLSSDWKVRDGSEWPEGVKVAPYCKYLGVGLKDL